MVVHNSMGLSQRFEKDIIEEAKLAKKFKLHFLEAQYCEPSGFPLITKYKLGKLKELNLAFYVHVNLPVYGFTLESLLNFVDEIRRSLDKAKEYLKFEGLTVHFTPGNYRFFFHPKEARKRMESLVKEFVQKCKIPISIENNIQYLDSIKEIKFFIKEGYYLTLDVAHAFYKNNIYELMEKFRKHILYFHLSDANSQKHHLPLGEGKINWKSLFDVVNKLEIKAPLILEVPSVLGLKKSIEFISQLK